MSYKQGALWRTDLFRREISEVMSVFLNISRIAAPKDKVFIANLAKY